MQEKGYIRKNFQLGADFLECSLRILKWYKEQGLPILTAFMIIFQSFRNNVVPYSETIEIIEYLRSIGILEYRLKSNSKLSNLCIVITLSSLANAADSF